MLRKKRLRTVSCWQNITENDLEVGQEISHFRRYGRELVSKPAISLKKCWGGYRGKTLTNRGKGRTTPVTTACMSRSWKVEVCQEEKKTLEEMINQQSAAMRSTSSTKQHKLICQLHTNTRPLALDRQTTTATESGTTATTKHAILLPTYHHLRVAQLNTRRNLYNTTLEALGTQPLAMLLAVWLFLAPQ